MFCTHSGAASLSGLMQRFFVKIANCFSLLFFLFSFFGVKLNLIWLIFCFKVLVIRGSPQYLSRQELVLVSIIMFTNKRPANISIDHHLCADKTIVSNWLWWGRAEGLHLSHSCQRVSDHKSMEYLKGCVGYFPFCIIWKILVSVCSRICSFSDMSVSPHLESKTSWFYFAYSLCIKCGQAAPAWWFKGAGSEWYRFLEVCLVQWK